MSRYINKKSDDCKVKDDVTMISSNIDQIVGNNEHLDSFFWKYNGKRPRIEEILIK